MFLCSLQRFPNASLRPCLQNVADYPSLRVSVASNTCLQDNSLDAAEKERLAQLEEEACRLALFLCARRASIVSARGCRCGGTGII